MPTTSRSLDVGARSCPEADRVGPSWPESPTGRPPRGRLTQRTTSGKARTGLLGEGGVRMSSPCTAPGMSLTGGKAYSFMSSQGCASASIPREVGWERENQRGHWSTPEMQRGPPLPRRIFPKSDPPYGGSASIPLTFLTRSPPLGSRPLGH